MPFIFKCFHKVLSVVFSCTNHMESFFFSAYLLIPSKELLAKSITPLVGLVTTPTKPLPIPEKGDLQVKLRFCKKLRMMARNIHICSMRIWKTFPQANYYVGFQWQQCSECSYLWRNLPHLPSEHPLLVFGQFL